MGTNSNVRVSRVRVSRSQWGLIPACLVTMLLVSGCSRTIDVSADELVAAESQEVPDSLALYLSLPPADSATERDALDRLEQAMERWRDGDRRVAAEQVDAALARLPVLGDWRPLILAELLAPAGDTVAVRRALGEVDPETELWARWGTAILAASHEDAGDWQAARETLRSAATAESNAARAASHWFSSGRLALAAGDSVSARDDLWRALSYGERVTAARSAARVLDRFPEELSPSDELLLGRVLLADGSWEAAHRRLSPHLQAPGGTAEEAAELRLGIGRALFELGRFIEAEDLLAPLAASTDASDFTLEALFWRGRAALEREALAAAAASFGEIADRAPESGLAGEGKLLLLQRELRSGFGPRARLLLEDLVRTEVRGTAAETLLMELGTLLYLEGDLQGAGRVFEALSAGSGRPAARQQAGYWTGLTLDRGGETTGAAARLAEVYEDDPFSTYGVFAGERVGAPVIDAEMSVGPSPVPGLAGELRNALARLRVHRLVPTSGSFAFELERLTEHFFSRGDGAYDFAEALVEGGFALQAISLGREIRRREDDWNLRLLRIVHPFPYRDIIVREAVSRGVDPFFVAGVIRQESAFDARIVSVSGATGLMQLMAPTAREVASSLGIRLTSESLNDPETNVRLGSTYLSTMLARFDGRAEDALAAYNAGPTRIRQWRGGSTYQDRDVFMEHIPFQETRNYVKVVQQYARIYTALYGCGDFEPCFGLSYPDVVARSSIAVGAPGPSAAR